MIGKLLVPAFAALIGWNPAAAAAPACASFPPSDRQVNVSEAQFAKAARVSGSALASESRLGTREATAIKHGTSGTLLFAIDKGRGIPIALIGDPARGRPRPIEWYLPPPRSGSTAATTADPAAILDAIGHVYAFVMRQDPQDRFVIGSTGTPQPRAGAVAHDRVLASLAAMHACVAARLQGSDPAPKIKPWRLVTIHPRPSRGAHGLEVSARVFDKAGKPAPGSLTFARGAHLSCAAQIQDNGEARCTLFDFHGHELHDDEHRERTVRTYSGFIGPDQILLPSTRISKH